MVTNSPVNELTPPADGSDKAAVTVTLSAADWRLIAENLYLDADAESAGPADLPCHMTQASTVRCADMIHAALQKAGWAK